MMDKNKFFVSVDVETSGPIPGEYSMLTVGACLVDDEKQSFSAALKPISHNADPKALQVTGLALDDLQIRGEEPPAAKQRFAVWLAGVAGENASLVFVGLNASFD